MGCLTRSMASFINILGESHSYTSLLEETTHEAMRRMTLAANVRLFFSFFATINVFIRNKEPMQSSILEWKSIRR